MTKKTWGDKFPEQDYEKYSDKQLKKLLKTTDKTKSERSFNKFLDIQDELNFRSKMKKKSKQEKIELYNEIMKEREKNFYKSQKTNKRFKR